MNNNDNVCNRQVHNTIHYSGLDLFRVISAFLIVAIHTSPLMSYSPDADFIFTRIIARAAVPFFFMVSGYFLLPRYFIDKEPLGTEKEKTNNKALVRFLKKTLLLYGAAILIYLPVNFYSGYFYHKNILIILKDILINGTFYHLWYLPAVITGAALVFIFSRYFKAGVIFVLSLILYGIGLFGDSYYGLSVRIPFLKAVYDFLFSVFDYTRNGFFFAPVFLVLGARIARQKKKLSLKHCFFGIGICSLFLFGEALTLHFYNLQRHNSMYLFLIPVMYYLFQSLLLWQGKDRKKLRSLSMIIYIIHPLAIIIVRGMAKFLGLGAFFIDNSLLHYAAVCVLSLLLGLVYLIFNRHLKKDNPDIYGRAWIEINLNHLKNNVKVINNILPEECTLMAVVKANAYGHGDVRIAEELNKTGIRSFAAATLSEGVNLRKNGIMGEILIFGYTHPRDFIYLIKYNLIQTIVDYQYAQSLNNFGKPVKVHLKIDTGMHRLGEDYNSVSHLQAIFCLSNLIIEGTYTHLSVSDSHRQEDMDFTKAQIDHFYDTIRILKELGCNPGKLHIQSSYGILNYPGLHCDYARIGIALYGVLSSAHDTPQIAAALKPVLSVKARIVMTKIIEKGDAVSYGRTFTASEERKIATVTIGYADGIPRNLENGSVLTAGSKAPIIGRICMDQLMIDVTGIPEVKPGDIVTVIGTDGSLQIKAEEIADQSGTITNELLTRLGNRLNRTYPI